MSAKYVRITDPSHRKYNHIGKIILSEDGSGMITVFFAYGTHFDAVEIDVRLTRTLDDLAPMYFVDSDNHMYYVEKDQTLGRYTLYLCLPFMFNGEQRYSTYSQDEFYSFEDLAFAMTKISPLSNWSEGKPS